MLKKYFYFCLAIFFFLSNAAAIAANNGDLKELEQDKARIDYLLKHGNNENECRELLKIVSKYKSKENSLNINKKEILFTVIKHYSSNKYLLELIELLADKSNINFKDDKGYSPLMYAAASSDKVHAAEFLIKLGADVNLKASAKEPPFPYMGLDNSFTDWKRYDYASKYTYKYYYSPLLLAAAFNKNPEMLDLLIKYGADKSAKDSLERDALELSIYYNSNNKIAERLIELGFYNHWKSEYCEPLIILAVLKNDYNLAKTLIERGTNIFQKAYNGKDVLTVAVENSYNLEMIKLLLDSGAKINDPNLIITAMNHNLNKDIAALLIKELHESKYINVDRKEWSELLLHAIYKNCDFEKIVKPLISYGGSVFYTDKDGDTPFFCALRFYKNYKIFSLLEQKGVDFFELDDKGNNAFLIAVKNGRLDLAEALVVVYKYDVKALNNFKENAFLCWFNNTSSPYNGINALNFLIKMGCDAEFRDRDGNTILMKVASEPSCWKLVKRLIEKKVNLETKNDYGETALLISAKSGITNNLFLLLRAGADINVRSKFGDSVLSIVAKGERHYWRRYVVEKSFESYYWRIVFNAMNFFEL